MEKKEVSETEKVSYIQKLKVVAVKEKPAKNFLLDCQKRSTICPF
jgi:hypothetical protein